METNKELEKYVTLRYISEGKEVDITEQFKQKISEKLNKNKTYLKIVKFIRYHFNKVNFGTNEDPFYPNRRLIKRRVSEFSLYTLFNKIKSILILYFKNIMYDITYKKPKPINYEKETRKLIKRLGKDK